MVFKELDEILGCFRPVFKHQATYGWFVVLLMMFLIRFDHHGMTSAIRWLYLEPQHYTALLAFFKTTAWQLEALLTTWATLVISRLAPMECHGRLVILGDGIKVCKEARKMPGVKKLHQASENSGKGEVIWGHHFNFTGLLAGNGRKLFCLPLQGRLAEGLNSPHAEPSDETIVTRMAKLCLQTARMTGRKGLAVVDAYFCTGPMFLILKNTVDAAGQQLVHLITRAKDNYVGYDPMRTGDGRYGKAGKVKRMEVFKETERFTVVETGRGPEAGTIAYACLDLIWQPLRELVRFVLVKDREERYILMCSDPTLPALDIIRLYGYRGKIEVMFLFLKHLIGGFAYRFWTKAWPRLNRRRSAVVEVLPSEKVRMVATAVEAIERHVNLAGMALGLLQYLALTEPLKIWRSYAGWLRTHASEIPSEAVV